MKRSPGTPAKYISIDVAILYTDFRGAYLNSNQVNALGNAVGGGADCASNVGAVTPGCWSASIRTSPETFLNLLIIAIASTDSIESKRGAAAKLRMGSINRGIDNVRERTCTGRVVISVGCGAGGAARDRSEAPSSASLSDNSSLSKFDVLGDVIEKVPDLILFNIKNLFLAY